MKVATAPPQTPAVAHAVCEYVQSNDTKKGKRKCTTNTYLSMSTHSTPELYRGHGTGTIYILVKFWSGDRDAYRDDRSAPAVRFIFELKFGGTLSD